MLSGAAEHATIVWNFTREFNFNHINSNSNHFVSGILSHLEGLMWTTLLRDGPGLGAAYIQPDMRRINTSFLGAKCYRFVVIRKLT